MDQTHAHVHTLHLHQWRDREWQQVCSHLQGCSRHLKQNTVLGRGHRSGSPGRCFFQMANKFTLTNVPYLLPTNATNPIFCLETEI